jgi:hypothetical protein
MTPLDRVELAAFQISDLAIAFHRDRDCHAHANRRFNIIIPLFLLMKNNTLMIAQLAEHISLVLTKGGQMRLTLGALGQTNGTSKANFQRRRTYPTQTGVEA